MEITLIHRNHDNSLSLTFLICFGPRSLKPFTSSEADVTWITSWQRVERHPPKKKKSSISRINNTSMWNAYKFKGKIPHGSTQNCRPTVNKHGNVSLLLWLSASISYSHDETSIGNTVSAFFTLQQKLLNAFCYYLIWMQHRLNWNTLSK